VLDGAFPIPVLEPSLALGCDHPVGPGIEEVLPDTWSSLIGRPGDDAIDDADGIKLLFENMGKEQGAEGLAFQPDGLLYCRFEPGEDGLGGPQVLLPLDPDLALDAVDFAQVPVAPALEGFLVEMRHGEIIDHRAYMSRRKSYLSRKYEGIASITRRDNDRFYDQYCDN
jgi:hypothetical protein